MRELSVTKHARGINLAKLFACHGDYTARITATARLNRTFNPPSCEVIFDKGAGINPRTRGARISENNGVENLSSAGITAAELYNISAVPQVNVIMVYIRGGCKKYLCVCAYINLDGFQGLDYWALRRIQIENFHLNIDHSFTRTTIGCAEIKRNI